MAILQNLLLIAVSISMVNSEAYNPENLVVKIKFKYTKNKAITGFSQDEKDNLVNIHNAYRSLVRPYGANMIEVSWDDDIAAFAQDWANQCTATHRGNRDLDPWINMGENLYWWYSGSYNEGQAVKYWWDEVQYYTMSTLACQKEEVCGHYITMVWGKTEKIGCGVARCDRLKDHRDYGRGAYYFVCNYSGRFVSKIKPYIATDIPCSSCDNTDFPKCRYNLCVTNDALINGEGYDGRTDMVGLYRTLNNTSDPSTETTTRIPSTTISQESTTIAWSELDEIDDYCRNRENKYVRNVCWRLNNMLRNEMGLPKAQVEAKNKRDEESALEGGKVGALSSRDVGSTTQSSDQLDAAFGEIDLYCKDRNTQYKRRVCTKIDNKMKDIFGVNDSSTSTD